MKPNYHLLTDIFYALNSVKAVHRWTMTNEQMGTVTGVIYSFLCIDRPEDDEGWTKLIQRGLDKAGTGLKVGRKSLSLFLKVLNTGKM